jgi:hypothetical protein
VTFVASGGLLLLDNDPEDDDVVVPDDEETSVDASEGCWSDPISPPSSAPLSTAEGFLDRRGEEGREDVGTFSTVFHSWSVAPDDVEPESSSLCCWYRWWLVLSAPIDDDDDDIDPEEDDDDDWEPNFPIVFVSPLIAAGKSWRPLEWFRTKKQFAPL